MNPQIKLALLFLLCLLSCKRIPLYEPSSDIYIKLEIKMDTEVSLNGDLDLDGNEELRDKACGKMPRNVRVCFYDPDTHKLVAQEFLPSEGGFVDVAPGVYDVIVYSLGCEVTQLEGTDIRAMGRAFTSAAGQTVKVTKAGVTTLSYDVIYEPDHLYVGRLEGVVIPVRASIDKAVVIEAGMRSLLETYSFEVRHVTGAELIRTASVYITGQASGKYLWDGRYPRTPCAVMVPAVFDAGKGHLWTVFNTFGRMPGTESDVLLNMVVNTTNGAKYQWVFDVTEQFDNPDNTLHEIVIDEEIVIPDDSSGGGFTAGVYEWDTEVVPIYM